MPNIERTGWRDRALVNWHWRHNLHCRAAGIRLLMLEYNRGTPVAVIDYRRYEDGVPNLDHPVYRAISELAGDLPFYLAYYDQRFGFCLYPVNATARGKLFNKPHLASESAYVRWQWNIRTGQAMRPARAALSDVKPQRSPDLPAGVPSILQLDGTSWMGEEISRRHREWGDDTPVVDLDFLLIDNNTAAPLALVEYKHAVAGAVPLSHPNIIAQKNFAQGRVPFFVVRYWNQPEWKFQPLLPAAPEMSEQQWIDRLRALRKGIDQREGIAA